MLQYPWIPPSTTSDTKFTRGTATEAATLSRALDDSSGSPAALTGWGGSVGAGGGGFGFGFGPRSAPGAGGGVRRGLPAHGSLDMSQGERPARVLYAFEGDPSQAQISLHDGESAWVIDAIPGDWWWGRNAAGEEGYFPATYVEIAPLNAPPPPPQHSSTLAGSTVIDAAPKTAAAQQDLLDNANKHKSVHATVFNRTSAEQRRSEIEEMMNSQRVDGWLVLYDDKTKTPFFYSPTTGDVSWEKPAEAKAMTETMRQAKEAMTRAEAPGPGAEACADQALDALNAPSPSAASAQPPPPPRPSSAGDPPPPPLQPSQSFAGGAAQPPPPPAPGTASDAAPPPPPRAGDDDARLNSRGAAPPPALSRSSTNVPSRAGQRPAEPLRAATTGGLTPNSRRIMAHFSEEAGDVRALQEQIARMRDFEEGLKVYYFADFVDRCFERHKKGIMGGKVSVREMGEWTPKAIKAPIYKGTPANLTEEAVLLFKRILDYMGENGTAKEGDGQVLSIILGMGERYVELNNEVWAQILKQLNRNPNAASIVRGWELLCACSAAFMPHEPAIHYLRAICASRRFESNRIGALAFRTWQRILPVETPLSARRLTPADLDKVGHCYVPHKVFGATLEGVLLKEHTDNHPLSPITVLEFAQEERVPLIVKLLARCIIAMGGVNRQGIFRLAADADSVSYFRSEIEEGDYGVLYRTIEHYTGDPDPMHEDYEALRDPSEAADLLKYWLRSLQTPLVPYRFYDLCLQASKTNSVEAAQDVVMRLPPPNRVTLKYLCSFFNKIASNAQNNAMSASNIALVISPNILRNEGNDALLFAQNAENEKRFVAFIIESADSL